MAVPYDVLHGVLPTNVCCLFSRPAQDGTERQDAQDAAAGLPATRAKVRFMLCCRLSKVLRCRGCSGVGAAAG